MSNAANRRQLVQEDIENFDCCLTFDVNEFCINNWPTLTFKNRQSVWSSLQNDENFDWSSVEEQINVYIESESKTNQRFVIPDTEEETDDEVTEEEEAQEDLENALHNYLLAQWEGMDEEEDDVLEDIVDYLITTIDEAVDDYFEDDDEEPDEESNDEDKSID